MTDWEGREKGSSQSQPVLASNGQTEALDTAAVERAELREKIAMAVGSFLLFDDEGGPDDVTLADEIGEAGLYEIVDRVLDVLPVVGEVSR